MFTQVSLLFGLLVSGAILQPSFVHAARLYVQSLQNFNSKICKRFDFVIFVNLKHSFMLYSRIKYHKN